MRLKAWNNWFAIDFKRHRMTVSKEDGGRIVHMPANPDRFEFDSEVAPLFPNMARRSIPLYHMAHRMHAQMAAHWFLHPGASVIDVGASRGEFFKNLDQVFAENGGTGGVRMVATDSSEDMCSLLKAEFPHVEVRHQDMLSAEFSTTKERYDVVNCMYVVQFLPTDKQEEAIRTLASMVKPGGALMFGQKEHQFGP